AGRFRLSMHTMLVLAGWPDHEPPEGGWRGADLTGRALLLAHMASHGQPSPPVGTTEDQSVRAVLAGRLYNRRELTVALGGRHSPARARGARRVGRRSPPPPALLASQLSRATARRRRRGGARPRPGAGRDPPPPRGRRRWAAPLGRARRRRDPEPRRGRRAAARGRLYRNVRGRGTRCRPARRAARREARPGRHG